MPSLQYEPERFWGSTILTAGASACSSPRPPQQHCPESFVIQEMPHTFLYNKKSPAESQNPARDDFSRCHPASQTKGIKKQLFSIRENTCHPLLRLVTDTKAIALISFPLTRDLRPRLLLIHPASPKPIPCCPSHRFPPTPALCAVLQQVLLLFTDFVVGSLSRCSIVVNNFFTLSLRI